MLSGGELCRGYEAGHMVVLIREGGRYVSSGSSTMVRNPD